MTNPTGLAQSHATRRRAVPTRRARGLSFDVHQVNDAQLEPPGVAMDDWGALFVGGRP